jgi:AmmeMemoRadiSam system protein A
MLTADDGRRLLELARDSIRCHLQGLDLPDLRDPSEGMQSARGAFVTLTRKGALRGCIGRIEAVRPLWITVREMAIAAACQDSRFPPVEADELARLDLEISVLSDLVPASGPKEIRIGTHGIYLRTRQRSGLLLPQVASERGWTPEQFLDRTCLKAGLPEGAWKKEAEILLFSCEIFDEHST